MKILLLCHNPAGTGTWVRAWELARNMARHDHETTLVAVSPDRQLATEERIEDGLRLILTPNILHDGFLLSRLTSCGGWGPLDIYARIREGVSRPWDIIQTFDHFPNVSIPFTYLRRKTGARFVSDWCDIFNLPGGFRDTLSYRLDFIYRRIAFPFERYLAAREVDLRQRSDAVTVISTRLRDAAVAHGIPADKILVVEGGADTRAIEPLDRTESRRALGLDQNRRYIVFLGRSQFDLDILIRSYAIVRRRYPDSRLLILGRNNFSWTMDLARELGVADGYHELGYVPAESVPLYLSSADVLGLPMKDNLINQTRWPNKIGEYMASGRPMVVSDVGDVADIVRNNGLGLVAGPGPDNFAAAIERLLSDRDLASDLGQRARKHVCSELSWDLLARRMEGLYTQLLTEKPRQAA